MAVCKLTAKMQYLGAGKGPAGWSENYYFNTTPSEATRIMTNVYNYRIRISAPAVSVVSIIAVDLANPGVTSQRGNPTGVLIGINPTALTLNDVPQMALGLKAFTSNNLKRTFRFPGIPDNVITNGRYAPTPSYDWNMQRFIELLTQAGSAIRTIDRSQTPVDVVSISSTGLVTMPAPQTWMAGVKLQLYRCSDSNKQGVVGTFPLVNVVDSTHFQLGQWGSLPAVVKGKIRLLLYAYPVIAVVGQPEVTIRKVGRPSAPYVGRRSTRK